MATVDDLVGSGEGGVMDFRILKRYKYTILTVLIVLLLMIYILTAA